MENECLIRIDGAEIPSRSAFYAAVRSRLPGDVMPGSNLDALHDALTGLPAALIEIAHEQDLRENLGPYWDRIRRVLAVSAGENPGLTLINLPEDSEV